MASTSSANIGTGEKLGDVPNAETLEAIKDVHEGRNLVGPFYTVKELMDYLHADD